MRILAAVASSVVSEKTDGRSANYSGQGYSSGQEARDQRLQDRRNASAAVKGLAGEQAARLLQPGRGAPVVRAITPTPSHQTMAQDTSMAVRPARPCSASGCPALVTQGSRCPMHYRPPFATAKRTSTLYSTAQWKRARANHLRSYPYCQCGAIANTVDHNPPHRGDAAAFFDPLRYVSMCSSCHNAKTGRETRTR